MTTMLFPCYQFKQYETHRWTVGENIISAERWNLLRTNLVGRRKHAELNHVIEEERECGMFYLSQQHKFPSVWCACMNLWFTHHDPDINLVCIHQSNWWCLWHPVTGRAKEHFSYKFKFRFQCVPNCPNLDKYTLWRNFKIFYASNAK